MIFLQILFWALVMLVFYAYMGYGVVLFSFVKIKRLFHQKIHLKDDFLPDVTLVVAAFNEESVIGEKIRNSLELDYPQDKIQYLFVTDGSTDQTPEIIKRFSHLHLLHESERSGKIAAAERAVRFATSEILIFTDANTFLNREAIKQMVRHFQLPNVGAVAGEKRILTDKNEEASGAGEGIYWRYESALKNWDSELHSVVGAAGELFAIRKDLYEPLPKDTIIEDFYLTLRIAQKGYKVAYESEAYAMEAPSASVKEEFKRKVRIAAGGIQAVVRLKSLLNPFKYGLLCFQYVSHRVLRWTLAPLALPFILALNTWLAFSGREFYQGMLALQLLFYALAGLGYMFESKKMRVKILFVPFYFCMMNFAVYKGFIKYMNRSQSVLWEKSERRKYA